jgi:putative ABC transport system permease protein
VVGWILIAPRMESAAGYRIDPTNVPWVLVAATVSLTVVASTAAAWWPGRTVSRIPTVLALSGRPPRPAPLHRSTFLAFGLLVVGVVCLVIGGRATNGLSTAELLVVCVGILGVAAGVLLVSPLAIRALAGLAGGAPIAERLALRDLGRFRARSAAALAAVALALGLPVVIVATTAAAENQLGPGNLPANQILVHQAELDGPFLPRPESVAGMQDGVDAIADALDGPFVIRLDSAVNPNGRPEQNTDTDTVPGISVARKHGDEGWADLGLIYVATPALLDQYGLDPDAADDAGILTRFALPVDIIHLGDGPPPRSADAPREASRPFQPLEDPGDLPDTYSALPGALVSSAEMTSRGWTAEPSGRWLIVNTAPLTADQLDDARAVAVQYGLSIETRDESTTLANVRSGAVAVGMVLALGILAMTVGLIRAESVGELRTLTAAGATGSIRRRITATTAGGLAALGALLGTAGAYLALVAAQIDDLAPVPVADLAIIVIGTPIAAAVVGWVFAGREPEVLGRRPID